MFDIHTCFIYVATCSNACITATPLLRPQMASPRGGRNTCALLYTFFIFSLIYIATLENPKVVLMSDNTIKWEIRGGTRSLERRNLARRTRSLEMINLARRNLARLGLARRNLARRKLARLGLARRNLVRLGLSRRSQEQTGSFKVVPMNGMLKISLWKSLCDFGKRSI